MIYKKGVTRGKFSLGTMSFGSAKNSYCVTVFGKIGGVYGSYYINT